MKLRNKLYSAILFASLLITGCNASTAPPSTTSAETVRAQAVMVANVDGGQWVSTAMPVSGGAQTAAVKDPLTPNTITVTGVAADHSLISITIPDPHVGEATVQAAYVTDPMHFVGSGTADITAYDTVNRMISGTFTFTAYEQLKSVPDNAPIMIRKIDVTNGIFSNFSWATSGAGAQ
jgi:hypothetical protein